MGELNNISKHLEKNSIQFEVIELDYALTRDSIAVLESIGIELEEIIVGVILNKSGRPCMAIIPAHHLLDPGKLSLKFSAKFSLIADTVFTTDYEISEFGYPPLPKYFNVEAIIEQSITSREWTYLAIEDDEGDFILKLSTDQFKAAVGPNAKWEYFGINTIELLPGTVADPNGIEEESIFGVPRFKPESLRKRLAEHHEFPVMSPTAQKILKLQSDPNAETDDLARIVEQSPTLAAQVIKWANSPYYGFPGSIKTINDAIVKVLGFDMVMNMALGLAIGDNFKSPLNGPIGLAAYWQHSVCTAALVEHLVKRIPAGPKRPLLGLAYLSGLLHNFGYLLLGELFPRHFQLINEFIPVNPHLSYLQIERAVLGVCHTLLGAWLMTAWHMPPEIIETTMHHHSDINIVEDHKMYVALTNAAVCLLGRLDIGDSITAIIDDDVIETIGLSEETLEETLAEIEKQLDDLLDFSKLLITT